MMKKRISRRVLLRGAGGIGLSLPFLEVMEPARASAQGNAAVPRKFIYFYTAHGIYKNIWRPQGLELTTLTDYLSAFEKHKNELILVSGLTQAGDSFSHNPGILCLTALPSGGGPAREVDGLGTSFDQILAAKQTTPVKSIQLGSKAGGNSATNRAISWAGKGQALLPQNNPYAFFKQLFSEVRPATMNGATGGAAEIEKIHARQGSVLDALRESFALFEKNVSAEDRRRLDAHLTGLRSIEATLTSPQAAPGGMCAVPDFGGVMTVDWNAIANLPTIIKVQMDLLAAAIACDLTRVCTFRLVEAWGVRDHGAFIPGHGGRWHDMAHAPGVNQKHVTVTKWYYTQIAYFLDKLKAIKEGDKDALYNSIVMHSPEYGGNENNHDHKDMCYVLAGTCGGKFKTKRNLVYTAKETNAQLFTSIAHAFGMPQSIGDPKYGTEPLASMLSG